MDSNLGALLGWLKRQYQLLGIEVSEDSVSESKAIWLTGESESDNADFFDRDVGVWVRFSSLAKGCDVKKRVLNDVRWALDAVSKLDVRFGVVKDNVDELGAWQVHVVWIVPSQCKPDWEGAIRELRRRSAHPEEIGLDLIDLGAKTVDEVLEEEGVPSLLLKTRGLLRLDASGVPKWLSPDSLFEEKIRSYVPSIIDEGQRSFSEDVVSQFLSQDRQDRAESSHYSVETFDRATFKDFRNVVDAELVFDYGSSALIVHGPNGSGKSSLFEALCLALFGTSKRHHEFLSDGDVTPKVRGDYVGNVLTRFGAPDGSRAVVALDGKDALGSLMSTAQESSARLITASGTVLAQESAREFVGMSSREAASLVLGDYSPRARSFQDEVDRGASRSRVVWQDWLRSLGLNASITKSETILRKLVGRAIAAQCPPLSQASHGWLRSLGRRLPEFAERSRGLLQLLDGLDAPSGREELTERVAVAIERSSSAAEVVASWLKSRSDALRQVSTLMDDSKAILDPLRAEWPRIKGEVHAWVQWLQQPTQPLDVPSVDEEARAARDKELRGKLAELTPRGQQLKARKEHLDLLTEKLLPSWKVSHEHVCPTCEAKHTDEIGVVIAKVARGVDEDYQKVRIEYADAQAELKALQTQAGKAGACPLSDDRMVELSEALGFKRTGPDSLEAMLRSTNGEWQAMLSLTESLFAGPGESAPEDPDAPRTLAHAVIAQVVEMRADGVKKQELPLQWDELKRKVDDTALQIVRNHLPKTVGAVWSEIALALAPSRWNQAASPRMSMDINRGDERLGIIIDGSDAIVPARHVLNQAEQHVLGLAWFFTRHLSHGRFVAPLIALDDPAQEMDQVTYRRFVRFLQAFLRMHRSLDRPFAAFILLHQEERALDLARATSADGALTILEWCREIRAKGPDATVRQLRLRNAEQKAPLPPVLGAAAAPLVSA